MDTNTVLELSTALGPVRLRPEQPADTDFLYCLFRSHAMAGLAAAAIDDTAREALIRMQFNAQNRGYRLQHPGARFDVIEHAAGSAGRLVVDLAGDVGWIVDIALLPDRRGQGLGTALLQGLLRYLGKRARVMRCSVMVGNEASLRMLCRAGFTQIGEQFPYRLMERRLDTAAAPP
jgi:ribosomal protein S18 acetylase RimI-like enzyme